MHRLSTYCIDGNVILSPKHRVRVWVKHKRMDLYVHRVETSLYKRMGWDSMHYLDNEGAKFNKSHHSLIFTDSKDRCVAYVAFANHTFKGCRNGIMISRFVIAPHFQRRGLSIVILNLMGAMLSASNFVLYFNTELSWLGKKVGNSSCWKGTTFDGRFRNAPSDERNKHRRDGVAWRKKYVGKALKGYADLFLEVEVLRCRMANKKATMAVLSTGAVEYSVAVEEWASVSVCVEHKCYNKKYMLEYEDSS